MVNQLSSPAETTPVVDNVRDQVLADVQANLGPDVIESLVKPGDDIWIRVSTQSWKDSMRKLQAMGFDYFCFLSAID